MLVFFLLQDDHYEKPYSVRTSPFFPGLCNGFKFTQPHTGPLRNSSSPLRRHGSFLYCCPRCRHYATFTDAYIVALFWKQTPCPDYASKVQCHQRRLAAGPGHTARDQRIRKDSSHIHDRPEGASS
ncbi:hypothetical protein M378DRAFT_465755 [Amanita muscaria Koide BX008]|uniref:Uncharacterized protein n=1 Tax=Amanita muscaria (strain Koide BX008) TaxID=946122 RepID=A0A0C2W616_AMAMK|nr:hypothetical protein M378DRAFT_465755 [Amanita muscaria Koide BX008]